MNTRNWPGAFAITIIGALAVGSVVALGAPVGGDGSVAEAAQSAAEVESEEIAPASSAEESEASSVLSAVAEPVYRVQPGDTLSITVLGEPDYTGSYAVRPDGTILFRDDMVGTVAVGYCTTEEATAVVTDRIGQFVKDPTVILAITRFTVMVTGEVRRPGQYELDAGARLMTAVEKAGGVEDERRSLDSVYVTRSSGEEMRFSLRDFKENGDASQNPVVEPGDRVVVGRAPSGSSAPFKVTGAVAKPGTYYLKPQEETRISDAIEEAGRWTDDAHPRAARLVREDGTEVTVDLTQLDENPASRDNLVLQEGDELFVPRNTVQVNVLGTGVQNPGQYKVAPGTTLLELISTAGGLAEGAVLRECAVVRFEPEAARIPADLERLMKRGDMSQNPELRDRDVVYVPGRPPAREGRRNPLASVGETLLRYGWMFRYF